MGLTSGQVLDDLVQGLQDAALGLKCDLGLGKQLEDVAAGERGDQLGPGNLTANGFSEASPEPSRPPEGQPLRQECPAGLQREVVRPRGRGSGQAPKGQLGERWEAAPDLGAMVWGRAGRELPSSGRQLVSVSV